MASGTQAPIRDIITISAPSGHAKDDAIRSHRRRSHKPWVSGASPAKRHVSAPHAFVHGMPRAGLAMWWGTGGTE